MKRKLVLITFVWCLCIAFLYALPVKDNIKIWVDQYDNGVIYDQPETPVCSECVIDINGNTHLFGLGTWFDATRNNAWYTMKNKWGKAISFYGAAGPRLRALMGHRYQQKPYSVIVTSLLTGRAVRVWVADFCGCGGAAKDKTDTRLIDLAPEIWAALGVPLGRGVMKIDIEIEGGVTQ
jgi:hypothetical protein